MKMRIRLIVAMGLFLVLLCVGLSTDASAQEKENTLLASQIVDHDVYDAKQELIGEVDDIIFKRSGKAKRITVEFGGFFDIGDRLAAVPIKGFSMKDGKIILDATRQQLQKRPEFSYYEHDLRPNYYYRPRPRPNYFNNRTPYGPYPHGAPSYYHYYDRDPKGPLPPIDPDQWVFSPSRFLASSVMNRPLLNEAGKDIGMLKDLLIDRRTNKIDKIVVLAANILDEDVHAALPYRPVGFTPYGIVYDISPQELKNYVYSYEE